jgi:8-oxo-dGTP diphosphatase
VGKINPGETPARAVVREALEECGLEVRVTGHLGDADQVVFTPGHAHGWRKRCTFFSADAGPAAAEPREVDHVLVWLAPGDAVARLTFVSHQWAVAEAAA